MNPENIHDALNLLPDDLIAEADTLRQRKPRTIPWKRLIPMAACFALVLGALYVMLPILTPKGSLEAAPEAAAPMEMMQDAMAENSLEGIPETAPAADEAPRAEPEENSEEYGAPKAPESASEEETQAAGTGAIPVTATSHCIGAEEPDETSITLISTWKEWNAFLDATPRLMEEGGYENGYGEAYFEEKQLIAVMTTAASSTVRYEIHSIRKNDAGIWELTGIRHNPAEQTDDMVQQMILVELPRMVEPEDTVVLVTVDLEFREIQTVEEIRTRPPELTLQSSGREAVVSSSSFQWEWDGVAVSACGLAPGSGWEGDPTLITDTDTVELTWPVMPDSITVRCWSTARSTETWNVEFPGELQGNILTLNPEYQIYVIEATWGDREDYGGTASYRTCILLEE